MPSHTSRILGNLIAAAAEAADKRIRKEIRDSSPSFTRVKSGHDDHKGEGRFLSARKSDMPRATRALLARSYSAPAMIAKEEMPASPLSSKAETPDSPASSVASVRLG